MELLAALHRNLLFKGLTEDEVKTIASLCIRKNYPGGSVIFREKSEESGMYILASGQVDIQMSMGADDAVATVIVIHEGDVFGELSLVDRSPRSATAKAAGEVIAFLLEAHTFDELCEKNTHIGLIMMKHIATIMASRLREINIKYTESLIWERLSTDGA